MRAKKIFGRIQETIEINILAILASSSRTENLLDILLDYSSELEL